MNKHPSFSPCRKPVIFRRNVMIQRNKHMTITHSGLDWNSLNTEAYYIGKGILVFTMLYCSMNLWMLSEEIEKRINKDKKKK